MNNTNRFLNRALILLTGMILLLLGTAAIVLATMPAFGRAWSDTWPTVRQTTAGWVAAARVPGTHTSWWWIALLGGLLLIVIALVVFIFRQGHGRTSHFVSGIRTDAGITIIHSRLPEQLLEDALRVQPALVGSRVSTYLVRRHPVLKVSVSARRGMSPKDILGEVETTIHALELLLGQPVLASVHISGGIRARLHRTSRLG
ncbi:MAG: hypothetical protein H7288_18095 [Kineosporiaceae bacterium]|nr:hypothetical protein [Aeromicrobium sp.]